MTLFRVAERGSLPQLKEDLKMYEALNVGEFTAIVSGLSVSLFVASVILASLWGWFSDYNMTVEYDSHVGRLLVYF